MGIEIERRFLVDDKALPKRLPRGERLVQGYLSFGPLVRVRTVEPLGRGRKHGLLTIKGQGTRVRPEFEYRIPHTDAGVLLGMCGERVLQKVRMRIGRWELDRYEKRHTGLWLAEMELTHPDEALPDPLPKWASREVTEDPRYTNSRLAQLKHWPPDWA